MSLIDKIRKARETTVEANGKKFTIRRPTEAEQAVFYKNPKFTPLDMVRQCVVGWDLQEIDVIPGGDPILLAFTHELWVEYVNDNSELWKPLSEAIKESVRTHNEKVERAEKK
ncbi:MAG: hypothetical protein Q8S71_03750 [Hydrogenophaga sp.]|nr:hypothetical protein [Hydrogenophaga sp.]